MEPMQDKEFDQFFKDKLEAAEVAPPAMLWAKVDAQLGRAPKKRFPMLWMAAAVAVVAVSAGLLFKQQDDRPVLGQPVVVTTAEKPVAETAPTAAVPESGVLPAAGEDKQQVALSPTGNRQIARLKGVTSAHEVETAPVKKQLKKESLAMQPSGQEQHLVNSRNEVKPAAAETFVVPARETVLALTIPEEPAMASIEETPQQDALANEYNAIPERKGISNVGDLVNFVVDKIDKREEKFLHFNTNDDDQSSLVSINIGIIKLNTKQKAKR
jgi:pyruvate/2-oxoglutarate dehydrogenase complex dihydrolipoamide acyltransferase (E2) component